MPLAQSKSLKRKSLADEVYEELRQQIIVGALRGGERLDIFEVAERLGVSRTPVKEAFNRLRLDGLLTIHPNRGTFVTAITAETIGHVFEARLMIEIWALKGLFASRSDLDLPRFQALLLRCEQVLQASGDFDWEQFVALDRDLHFWIVNAAGNPVLSRLYESVFPQVQFVRVYSARTRERAWTSHQQHLEILAAIRGDSAPLAEELLRSHILSSQEHVMRLLGSAMGSLGN